MHVRLAESLGVELRADRDISVNSSLTYNLGKQLLANKHSMLCRTKQWVYNIPENLNTEQTVRLRIDDDVSLVES